MKATVVSTLSNVESHIFVQYRYSENGMQRYDVLVVSADEDEKLFDEANKLQPGDCIEISIAVKKSDEQCSDDEESKPTPLAKRTTWKRILRDRRKN